MNKKTAIKNQIIILLSIVILAMLFVFIIQKQRLKLFYDLNDKDEMPPHLSSESMPGKTSFQYENDIAQLQLQINDIKFEEKIDRAEDIEDMIENIEESKKDLLVDIENEIKNIKSKYKPFYEELGLSGDEILSLLDILLDERIEGELISRNLLELTFPDDIELEIANFKKEFVNVLGEKTYEELKLYRLTFEDRDMLNGFNELLDDTNKLDRAQIDGYSTAFNSIRRKYFLIPKYVIGETEIDYEENQQASYFGSHPTQEMFDQLKNEYLEKAEELLPEDLFGIFETYYNTKYAVTILSSSE